MNYFLYGWLFGLGLIIGSFLNVVTIRYRPERAVFDLHTIGGRSHCPICYKQLAWYELIPLFSFLFIRGKCRHCGHRLSLQYPIIELLSGLIFVVVPWQLSMQIVLPVWYGAAVPGVLVTLSALWIAAFLAMLVLAVIDLKYMIIPDSINVFLAVIGVAIAGVTLWHHGFGFSHGSFLQHYAALFGLRNDIVVNRLVAALVGPAFFGSIILATKGRGMGWGDFKLAGALGLLFGWPDVLMVFFLSFIVGSVVSLVLLARKRKGMRDAVPFGPFLVIGSVLTFFFGYAALSFYFGLFAL